MSRCQLIFCIGASTGGIRACEQVLSGFPADSPPTLLVQHIPAGFSQRLVYRLDRICEASVTLARDKLPLRRGQVVVAPGGESHLEVETGRDLRCRLVTSPPQTGHRPSVDVLFHSAAQSGAAVVCALMTGMGRDGAEGMLSILKNGGRTIAQDQETSTVYGMPRAAVDIGAAEYILPLNRIAPALFQLGRTLLK